MLEAEFARRALQSSPKDVFATEKSIVGEEDPGEPSGLIRVTEPLRPRDLWEGREPAGRTEVYDLHALTPGKLSHLPILSVNFSEVAGEPVPAGPRKEVVICEVHADQPNPCGAHVDRQLQRDKGGVPRVMEPVGIFARIRSAAIAESKPDNVGMPHAKFKLSEQSAGAASLHIPKPVPGKLALGVEYHQIRRVEQATDVIDADGDEPLGVFELAERGSAAADKDCLVVVKVAEACQRGW
jgi:hypothetical protein